MRGFRVLGPVQAWGDGSQIPVGGSRQPKLFAFLRAGQSTLARTSADAACALARTIGDNALLGRALSRLASVLPRPARLPVVEHAGRLLSDRRNEREVAQLYLNAAYSEIVEDHSREALRFLDAALAEHPLAAGA